MAVLQIKLNEVLYVKDPQSTELGKRIVEKSIQMISKLGFEAFTFKKLSIEIESTEPSIYRYFENKHRLLVYLITWYWAWLEYNIDYQTNNILDPKLKLEAALRIISFKKEYDSAFPDVDESALHEIVISESEKVYLTKQVDADNKDGLFRGYKSLCKKISLIIQEVNPEFAYPRALISTVLEASNQQIFFAEHLPALTESSDAEDRFDSNFNFIKTLVFNSIMAKNGQ